MAQEGTTTMNTDWITCPDCIEDHEGVTLCERHRPAPERDPFNDADWIKEDK